MSHEKIERNLRILIDLSAGEREQEVAEKYRIRQQVVHKAAETTAKKIIRDEQIQYLSLRGALTQYLEIPEIAKYMLTRLQQLKRGTRPPKKLTPQNIKFFFEEKNLQ